MTTTTAITTLPRLTHTGKVTQLRLVLSDGQKLRSVRSTRWSLLVAFVVTAGLPFDRGDHVVALGLDEPARAGRPPPARHPALFLVNLSQLASGCSAYS